MYGLIHQAARSLVVDKFGHGIWSDILKTTGLGEDAFVTSSQYPDSTTFTLVTAIAKHLSMSVDDTLAAFGRYWISYTDKTTYAPVMRISGDTLEEFLGNLDRMHASIKLAIPEADLPSFKIVEERADGLDLLYRSNRGGLNAFVVGLLEGLMERFNVKGSIHCDGASATGSLFRLTYSRAEGSDHVAA